MEDKIELDKYGLSLIPGPKEIPQPYSSVYVNDITEYSPNKIADALLSIEGIKLLTSNISTMWDWKAEYVRNDSKITFEMTCMGDFDEIWGGFPLSGSCKKKEILKIWKSLKEKGYQAVWFHDADCAIYTPEGFRTRFYTPSLQKSEDADQTTAARVPT